MFINAGGINNFDLSPPFPLAGATDGLTMSVFAAGVTHLSFEMSPSRPARCNASIGVGVGGTAVTSVQVNGVNGIVARVPQQTLAGIISDWSSIKWPGCNVTANDFAIIDLGAFSQTGVVTVLDAASLGLGQGNVPLP